MSVYFKFACQEGFSILHGDKKRPQKAYIIGVVYDSADADIFVKALTASGKEIEEVREEELSREEPVEDLVEELQRGLKFNVKEENYDHEWQR